MYYNDASPIIAIIIATRNAEQDLPFTLHSIATQYCKENLEVIVQDCLSTDHTLNIVNSYAMKLPRLRVSSVPDDGVYDAWLKAIPLVCARWILFLGAGDTLAAPDTLQCAMDNLEQCPDNKYFAVGQITILSPERKPQYSILNNIKNMAAVLPYYNPIYHAGVFTRSDFLKEHPFDSSFKILGDYDFFCKYWNNGENAYQLYCLIAEVPLGGISNSPKFKTCHDAEISYIRKKYFFRQYLYLSFYKFCKKIIPKKYYYFLSYSTKRYLKKIFKFI